MEKEVSGVLWAYVLGDNLMGRPFWGSAKGPYWMPFCAPTIDHLQNATNRAMSAPTDHEIIDILF